MSIITLLQKSHAKWCMFGQLLKICWTPLSVMRSQREMSRRSRRVQALNTSHNTERLLRSTDRQAAGHASSLGPTAPLLIELVQLPRQSCAMAQFTTTSQRCGLILQLVLAVTKVIFVRTVGPRCSVNSFNCVV